MSKVYYVDVYSGVHKNVRPKDALGSWVYTPFWSQEEGGVVWDFKGQEGNSNRHEKAKVW